MSGYTTATTLEIKPKSSDLRQQGMLNLVSKALEVSVIISDSELEEGLIHGLGKASFSATLFSKGQFPSMQGRPHSLGSSVLVLAWWMTRDQMPPSFERSFAIKWKTHNKTTLSWSYYVSP